MKFDLFLVMQEEGVEVWPISDAGADAVKTFIPDWGLGAKVMVEMMPEEFQALFPEPLKFLAMDPDTGVVRPFSRKPLQ